jgi:anti-anti-sigma factor
MPVQRAANRSGVGRGLATVLAASQPTDTRGAHVQVNTVTDFDTVTAKVVGEVDADNCGEVESAVRSALGDHGRALVVDASELTFLDSSGISTMLQLRNLVVEERDGTFRLQDPTPVVRRTLEITGLLEVLGAS